uniref:Uncharacterized protein n=1 Tax=Mycena chlorophos TaxID=658473 RepID=A0ABQ0L5S3_MYCCL|nr:predicted protein [Mycena chlorophos]
MPPAKGANKRHQPITVAVTSPNFFSPNRLHLLLRISSTPQPTSLPPYTTPPRFTPPSLPPPLPRRQHGPFPSSNLNPLTKPTSQYAFISTLLPKAINAPQVVLALVPVPRIFTNLSTRRGIMSYIGVAPHMGKASIPSSHDRAPLCVTFFAYSKVLNPPRFVDCTTWT